MTWCILPLVSLISETGSLYNGYTHIFFLRWKPVSSSFFKGWKWSLDNWGVDWNYLSTTKTTIQGHVKVTNNEAVWQVLTLSDLLDFPCVFFFYTFLYITRIYIINEIICTSNKTQKFTFEIKVIRFVLNNITCCPSIIVTLLNIVSSANI